MRTERNDGTGVTGARLSAPGSYRPELTSLRALGALWVALGHAVEFGALGFLSGAAWILGTPYLGVDLFFVLSAFLLMQRLDADPSVAHYFRRRIVRIWPLYMGVVIAVAVWQRAGLWATVAQLTFTGIWTSGGAWWTFWSLQVEELAYLVFPLIAALAIQNRVRAGWTMIAFSGAWAVFCLAPIQLPSVLTWWRTDWMLPFPWVGVFGWGILASAGRVPNVSRLWPAAFLPALLTQIPVSVGALAIAPVFASLCQRPPATLRVFSLQAIGEISYPLYLVALELTEAFGALGLVAAFPLAAALEGGLRGRQIYERLFPLRPATDQEVLDLIRKMEDRS